MRPIGTVKTDAETLRAAADILRRTSINPGSMRTRIIVNVLRNAADSLDAAKEPSSPPPGRGGASLIDEGFGVWGPR